MPFYRRQRPEKQNTSAEIRKELTLIESKRKLMDLVARRDHTEKELRSKLRLKTSPEIVDETISWAREQNWLASPDKLQKQLSDSLSRRGKGVRKINQKLKELGLQEIKADHDLEYEKAQKLVTAKWTFEDFQGLDFSETQKLRAKIVRYLVARGFESSVASKILKNEFKTSSLNEEQTYDEEL